MKLVKQTAEYSIYQRRDGRYAVRKDNRAWVNGDDKVAILQSEGLQKKPEPKPEPAAEEASEEATEE